MSTNHHRHRRRGELAARTKTGARMVEQAECFAEAFRAGALEHDRAGTFASEHLQSLRAAGFLNAPVPAALGGGGVDDLHDVLVAASRLARGDAATAIGVNMHFAVLISVVRAWRTTCCRGRSRQADQLGEALRNIAANGVVFATAVSESAGQDLARPATTAQRVGGGYIVNGTKRFATMARAADVVNVAVTYEDDDCRERYGFAMVPSRAAGVEFHDDWDATGMRASDSGSVTFRNVHIGRDDLRGDMALGTWSVAMFDRYLASGAFHAAASLGIAEQAHTDAVTALGRRAEVVAGDAHVVVRLAENVVDLTTMRATFAAAASVVDAHAVATRSCDANLDEAQHAFATVQAAKQHLNEAAQRVTDRALALVGGSGYLSGHPLAKAWRDARAGAFMHPMGANRAPDLLARTELGLLPKAG